MLKCPKCNLKSQRRFNKGRSLRMHLIHAHGVEDLSNEELEALEAKGESLEAQCRREAEDRRKILGSKGCKRKRAQNVREFDKKRKLSKPEWVLLAQSDDLEGLQELESKKEWSFEKTDRHGATAEQYAAGAGARRCLKFCIAKRFETCARHKELLTCAEENLDASCTCAKELKRRKDGRNALHWAARNGQLGTVEYLIEQCRFQIDAETFDGTTPIMFSVFGASLEVAKFLIKHGAEYSRRNDWGCDLSHWIAISKGNNKKRIERMCSWLHQKLGFTFETVQNEGRTALHKAAFINNTGFIDWMKVSGKVTVAACKEDLKGKRPSDLAQEAGFLALHESLKELEWSPRFL